jgi:hypothetical protein
MVTQKNLGQKCRYTEGCSLYHGAGIPRSMKLNLWRNVFCYRGTKGWSNCEQYAEFEKGELKSSREAI